MQIGAVDVVDAHIHFWDPFARTHDWLVGEPQLHRRFGPEDVDFGHYRLAAAIFVQADCRDEEALDEVRWVQQLAEQYPAVRGIVAYAPVQRGRAAEPQLAELAAEPFVVGVRMLLQHRPLSAFLDPNLADGVRIVGAHRLTFDLCVTHDQLSAVAALVESCADTRFVLDHLGKPPIAIGSLDPWRADLTRLAGFPNVTCKLSGLVTEAGEGWTSANLRPYLEHALTAFGPQRCLVGSDWPVLTLLSTVERWLDSLLDVVGELSSAEQDAVLRATALSVYGIDR